MIRKARWADVPWLKKIWKEAFGDSDEYLDFYFKGYFHPEKVFVWEEEYPVSMVTVYDHEAYVDEKGQKMTCPCIFAVATLKAFQGKQYAMKLIWHILKEQEVYQPNGAIMIAPADEGLRKLYHTVHGFSDYFSMKHLLIDEKNIKYYVNYEINNSLDIQTISTVDYARYRKKWLTGHAHLDFTQEQLKLEEQTTQLSGGGFFSIRQSGKIVGLMIVERGIKGEVFVKELLIYGVEVREALANIIKELEGTLYDIRMVPWQENIEEAVIENTAMMRRGNREVEGVLDYEKVAYAGLVFD